MQYGLVESYNDIELTCVVAVRDIWQIQPSWLHPCKVCDHGRSVGKIKFTRNRKMWGSGSSPPPRKLLFRKSWNCGKTFENKAANCCFLAVFETILSKLKLRGNF